MRYKVQLKSTVTWWETVEMSHLPEGLTAQEMRELAADEAVELGRHVKGTHQETVRAAGLSGYEWGPVELAFEELDESVREAPNDDPHCPVHGDGNAICTCP